jgi:acyl-CoA reductase-like NAD-dependent aldehyde dehydrogenase
MEFPYFNGCMETSSALAAGNTVVLKPAESTQYQF